MEKSINDNGSLKNRKLVIENRKLDSILAFWKSLPTSLCQREEMIISPFGKGGLRGIL